jgi:aminoglycoside phosphotransferase (APT) family kinase protein
MNLRNPDELRRVLLPWLRRRLPGASDIDLPQPQQPDAGGSSETFLLDPMIHDGGMQRRAEWVLRIQATSFQVYLDPSVERQFRVLQLLGQSAAAPVPRTLWYEPDPRILGAPFFVMERVAGRSPGNVYHARGLFADATPTARTAMWCSALQAMARIHRADVTCFGFLARAELGATGLEQELAYWDQYARWCGSPLRPVQLQAREWLRAQLPRERGTGLAWGDARPGNMLFRDDQCVAVIDWETVSLAGAETDLGWWLFYDWMVSAGMGTPRLAGLGDRTETIGLWEQFVGRKAQALDWHEVFATWRYSLVSDRARQLMRDHGAADAPPAAAS